MPKMAKPFSLALNATALRKRYEPSPQLVADSSKSLNKMIFAW